MANQLVRAQEHYERYSQQHVHMASAIGAWDHLALDPYPEQVQFAAMLVALEAGQSAAEDVLNQTAELSDPTDRAIRVIGASDHTPPQFRFYALGQIPLPKPKAPAAKPKAAAKT